MALARICSECSASLEGKSPRAVTCSTAHRQARARRLRKANVDHSALKAAHGVRELVRRGGHDAIQEALKTELAPVVREAIDEDVLKAIQRMVGLTTQAVAVLEDDLLNEDDRVMRQRAAALVVKYTVGHPALVKATDEVPPSLEVHFNLPRPDAEPTFDEEGEVLPDTKVCDKCGAEKAAAEFVAGSDRCAACFDEYRAVIRERFG